MKKIFKWGGIIIIGFIVIGVIAGIAGVGKSGSTTQPSGSSGTTTQQQAQEPMKITARELADDFDGNQVAAESKWKGKLVEFSAEISNITDTGLSFTNVASKQFSMTQISCKVNDKQQLLSLKNGGTVTVKGMIGKQTIGVIDMTDCAVVK